MVEMEAKQRDVDEKFAEEAELTDGALRAAALMSDARDLNSVAAGVLTAYLLFKQPLHKKDVAMS